MQVAILNVRSRCLQFPLRGFRPEDDGAKRRLQHPNNFVGWCLCRWSVVGEGSSDDLPLPSPFLPAMRPGSWARCPPVPAPTCFVVHLQHDSLVLFKEPFSSLSPLLRRRLSPSPPRHHASRRTTKRSSVTAAIISTAHGEPAYTKIHEAKPT